MVEECHGENRPDLTSVKVRQCIAAFSCHGYVRCVSCAFLITFLDRMEDDLFGSVNFPDFRDLPLLPQVVQIDSSDTDIDIEGVESALDKTCSNIDFDPKAE